LQTKELRRRNPHNRERNVLDEDALSQRGGVSPETPRPITVTDHRYRVRSAEPIVVRSDRSTDRRRNAQHGEEIAGYILPRDSLRRRAFDNAIEPAVRTCDQSAQGLIALAPVLEGLPGKRIVRLLVNRH
jgi:hypothetical protein